ncbi:MAG: nucleotidyltransferase [Bacteroidetes bacterium]|nr:MAG: nucleotidyltransferase [Bacteroidota bacterium]
MNSYLRKREKLVKLLRAHATTIRRFGALRLGLFKPGGHAYTRPARDLSMLVEFAQGEKSYHNFVHLMCFLEDLLHKEVELITPDSLSPYIRSSVLAEVQYVSFDEQAG